MGGAIFGYPVAIPGRWGVNGIWGSRLLDKECAPRGALEDQGCCIFPWPAGLRGSVMGGGVPWGVGLNPMALIKSLGKLCGIAWPTGTAACAVGWKRCLAVWSVVQTALRLRSISTLKPPTARRASEAGSGVVTQIE